MTKNEIELAKRVAKNVEELSNAAIALSQTISLLMLCPADGQQLGRKLAKETADLFRNIIPEFDQLAE